jgi:hypothetical protein
MPSITLTDVVANTLADAGVMNNNNSALRSVINGGIDNSNVSPNAGLQISKLALPGGTTVFLRGDGAWTVPPGTAVPPTTSDVVYNAFTNAVNITATAQAGAQAIITATAFTADGVSNYWVEVYLPSVYPHPPGRNVAFDFWDGGSDMGICALAGQSISGGVNMDMKVPLFIKRFLGALGGAHTYSLRGWQTNGSGTSVINEVGGVGYIRIFKA